MSPAFSAELRPANNGVTNLVLKGELDLATVPVVEERMPELLRPGHCLVIDMSGLTFIDSSGIEMLVRADAAAARDGWQLALVPGPPHVQQVLRLVGLEERLPFLGSAGLVA